MNRFRISAALAIAAVAVAASLYSPPPAEACGGLFSPPGREVVQEAERIIFTQNGDGTMSAYMHLAYVGEAEDFSWILPLPEAIDADDVEVPEGAGEAFREIEAVTDPVFVLSKVPNCVVEPSPTYSFAMGGSAPGADPFTSVQVYTSGQAGPYEFDVIGSEDPDALVSWLRENRYRVTSSMAGLIDLYVQEEFVFLAMKLGQTEGGTKPVKVTYPSESPMIPLRIAAVAAALDVEVMVWIYADMQAVPLNYARMEIADEEVKFYDYDHYQPTVRVREKGTDGPLYIGSNYKRLMRQNVDDLGGRAFVTEFAGPSADLDFQSPLLKDLASRHPYLTRLKTIVPLWAMTEDPVFDYDGRLEDVSNVRDLTGVDNLFDCDPTDWSGRLLSWLFSGLFVFVIVVLVLGLLLVFVGAPVALIVWLLRGGRGRARGRREDHAPRVRCPGCGAEDASGNFCTRCGRALREE